MLGSRSGEGGREGGGRGLHLVRCAIYTVHCTNEDSNDCHISDSIVDGKWGTELEMRYTQQVQSRSDLRVVHWGEGVYHLLYETWGEVGVVTQAAELTFAVSGMMGYPSESYSTSTSSSPSATTMGAFAMALKYVSYRHREREEERGRERGKGEREREEEGERGRERGGGRGGGREGEGEGGRERRREGEKKR